jgi:hypothetical protein
MLEFRKHCRRIAVLYSTGLGGESFRRATRPTRGGIDHHISCVRRAGRQQAPYLAVSSHLLLLTTSDRIHKYCRLVRLVRCMYVAMHSD